MTNCIPATNFFRTTSIVLVMMMNSIVHGLVVVPQSKTSFVPTSTSTAPSSTILRYAKQKQQEDLIGADEMRQEIEQMRQEAIQRLDALNKKMNEAEKEISSNKPSSVMSLDDNKATKTIASESGSEMLELKAVEADALERREAIAAAEEEEAILSSNKSKAPASSQLKLLDDTRWRLSLNVGREPGTWMPKDWGVSGERLYLNLEVEFSPEQLYGREEFLNGISGTKVLKVVHNEANLAPNMKEGGKRTVVSNGGWRVAPGEGPMGTTVLRFYVELEEQMSHKDSDVYCPKGRIYCTCGYFPVKDRESGSTARDALQQEQKYLVAKYEKLATENEQDQSLISLGKLKRGKQMMDLRVQANELQKRMNECAVQNPDRSILRFSRDQSVGLTREGGLCCKVQKGLAIEYHILGKFEIASMENREHKDYRELLD